MSSTSTSRGGLEKKPKKPLAVPRPSSSVLLISPDNQILLLHRVQTSTSFPSAHVFPGGNVSTFHDGKLPEEQDPARHQDGEAYRLAAIRETFEESGILIAKNNGFGRLIEVPESERESGRKEIYSGKISFPTWLAKKGGRADTENLIPFTRWITPTNIPKRFTTQMYLYFLPTAKTSTSIGQISTEREAVIPVPTSDGGIEHTAARFLSPREWMDQARTNKIILFPPQFFLLHLISQFLVPPQDSSTFHSPETLQQQRKELLAFVKGGQPPWGEVCISPNVLIAHKKDGRTVLSLDKCGKEVEGQGRQGAKDWVVVVGFRKDGPRDLDIRKREEVFAEERLAKENL